MLENVNLLIRTAQTCYFKREEAEKQTKSSNWTNATKICIAVTQQQAQLQDLEVKEEWPRKEDWHRRLEWFEEHQELDSRLQLEKKKKKIYPEGRR